MFPTQNAQTNAQSTKQLVNLLTTTIKLREDAVIELESTETLIQIRRTLTTNFTLGLSVVTLLKDDDNDSALVAQQFAFEPGLNHLRSLLSSPPADADPPDSGLYFIGDDDLYRTVTDQFLVRLTTESAATDLETTLFQ